MEEEERGGTGDEEEHSRSGAEGNGARGERGEGEARVHGACRGDRTERPGEQRHEVDGDQRAKSDHGEGGAAEGGGLPLPACTMPDRGGGGEFGDGDGGVDAGGVVAEKRGGLLRLAAGGAAFEVGAKGGLQGAGAQGVAKGWLVVTRAGGHEEAFREAGS